ncbi:MAG: ComEC/Rec2 family competence protein [Lachnospiraceae bacterium]|nr:ComEC/Rec2 family competence protein [Lachnospiraceae bacterium]
MNRMKKIQWKTWNGKRGGHVQLLGVLIMLMFLLCACGNTGSQQEVTGKSGGNSTDNDTEDTLATDEMQVHFMDVGHGDSTLITCGDHAMLIDTGDDSKGTTIQNYIQKRGIKKLDYLILTHPDKDHIGGAPVIITKFDIDQVFMSYYEKDSKTYKKVLEALDYRNLNYTTPEVGTVYTLGSAKFTVIAPNGGYDQYGDDSNNSSIGFVLENGKNRFLFTGDAEEAAENDIVKNGIDIRADVYQVGHHGSKTSTTEALLESVQPSFAVISCGVNDDHGHPNAQTLNRLRGMGVQVYRTDEQGSIIATSDGEKITWNCAPSTTWKSGEGTKSSDVKTEAAKENGTVSDEKKDLQDEIPDMEDAEVETQTQWDDTDQEVSTGYVLNTKSMKFHLPTCNKLPSQKNREDTDMSRDEIIAQGYEPCKRCNP